MNTQEFDTAYRIVHVTYDAVRDPKLFIVALEHLHKALEADNTFASVRQTIHSLLAAHQSASVVFRRDGALVICDDAYRTTTITKETLETLFRTIRHDIP